MFSWCNLILKLQISDLPHQKVNGQIETVLESLVKALARGLNCSIERSTVTFPLQVYVIVCSTLITSHFLILPESSKRTRRPLGVTIFNMISMPKGSNLPSLSEARPAQPSFESKTIISPAKVRHASSSSGKLVKNNADTVLISSKLDRLGYTKASKTSAENWLPDTFRLKSRSRELSTVQTTLDEVLHSELDSSRRQKRSAMNAYEKALNEESLSMVKKQPCGCCLQKYLYVNLPLKVSRKAIIDIRVKWTGNFAPPNIAFI